MRHTQTYPVNRFMHMRPCTEASSAAENLKRENSGLKVFLYNPRNNVILEGYGLVRYMTELQPLVGDRIQITLEGDLPFEKLADYSGLIGSAFSSFEEIPVIRTDD